MQSPAGEEVLLHCSRKSNLGPKRYRVLEPILLKSLWEFIILFFSLVNDFPSTHCFRTQWILNVECSKYPVRLYFSTLSEGGKHSFVTGSLLFVCFLIYFLLDFHHLSSFGSHPQATVLLCLQRPRTSCSLSSLGHFSEAWV